MHNFCTNRFWVLPINISHPKNPLKRCKDENPKSCLRNTWMVPSKSAVSYYKCRWNISNPFLRSFLEPMAEIYIYVECSKQFKSDAKTSFWTSTSPNMSFRPYSDSLELSTYIISNNDWDNLSQKISSIITRRNWRPSRLATRSGPICECMTKYLEKKRWVGELKIPIFVHFQVKKCPLCPRSPWMTPTLCRIRKWCFDLFFHCIK